MPASISGKDFAPRTGRTARRIEGTAQREGRISWKRVSMFDFDGLFQATAEHAVGEKPRQESSSLDDWFEVFRQTRLQSQPRQRPWVLTNCTCGSRQVDSTGGISIPR
jgi:hypothetical protein